MLPVVNRCPVPKGIKRVKEKKRTKHRNLTHIQEKKKSSGKKLKINQFVSNRCSPPPSPPTQVITRVPTSRSEQSPRWRA